MANDSALVLQAWVSQSVITELQHYMITFPQPCKQACDRRPVAAVLQGYLGAEPFAIAHHGKAEAEQEKQVDIFECLIPDWQCTLNYLGLLLA